MVSFFGPSGAGKTTMLRLIAGLTEAEEGYLKVDDEVWLDSKTGVNLAPRKRRVGFVFQDYALFPNMTVRENLRFAQGAPDRKHVDELLEIFGLTGLQGRKPATLSGGQCQRVALARALARRPRILLLDEPLSALDLEMRISLQDEIMKVHRLWNITTILVSHDLPEVFKLCDRVFSFRNGAVTDEGNPHDIFSKSRMSGKIQLVAEVLESEREDIVTVLTLLIGNSPVKVALSGGDRETYLPGDRVLVASKAFNPIISKINSDNGGFST
jgi:molybdate transport system ATP-binding protein